jgi:mono/diheme cytochrome c family protein
MYHAAYEGFGRRQSARVFRQLHAVLTIAALFCASATAAAADAQAGRSVAQSKCVECHDADDWEGEDAASLESLIRDIVAGKVKHKRKVDLTAAEIANIAAYWGQGRR